MSDTLSDYYIELIALGHSPEEAASAVDAVILDFDEWSELYGDQGTPDA